MPDPPIPTYEREALDVLAYEFPFSDPAEAERRIRGRLRRKKLGRYDAERIALLRRFKDDIQAEVGRFQDSSYYRGPHGQYADMADFDVGRLTADMIVRHPQVPPIEIESFVPFGVFLYYLR